MIPSFALRRAVASVGLLFLGFAVESFSGSRGVAHAASAQPALVFETTRAQFGEVYQGSVLQHTFPFENRGSTPVTIHAVIPRSEGATGEAIPAVVPAGGRGEVRVRIPIADRLGETNFRIAIDSDDPAAPRVRLGLSGFVQSAYQPADVQTDFGVVDVTRGRGSSFPLASREVERLEVLGFESSVPWLTAEVQGRSGEVGEEVRLFAQVAAGAPLGLHRGRLIARTNVAHQPSVSIPFVAAIYGDIIPDRNPVSLGLARVGEQMQGEVRLSHRNGEAFDFAKFEAPPGFEVIPAPCPGEETVPSCLLLRIVARPSVPGTLEGEVTVWLVGVSAPLPLRFSGVVAGTNTEIRTIDLTRLAPESDNEPWATAGASAVSRDSATLAESAESAGSGAASPTPVATPPAAPSATPTAAQGATSGPEAVLRWQASNQGGVYGYLVMRSRDRVGPFVRVNDGIVRVREGATGSQAFEFRDRNVEFGATYHYYLDLVTVGGTTRRFSGVLSKTVPPKPEATPLPSSDARNPNP